MRNRENMWNATQSDSNSGWLMNPGHWSCEVAMLYAAPLSNLNKCQSIEKLYSSLRASPKLMFKWIRLTWYISFLTGSQGAHSVSLFRHVGLKWNSGWLRCSFLPSVLLVGSMSWREISWATELLVSDRNKLWHNPAMDRNRCGSCTKIWPTQRLY